MDFQVVFFLRLLVCGVSLAAHAIKQRLPFKLSEAIKIYTRIFLWCLLTTCAFTVVLQTPARVTSQTHVENEYWQVFSHYKDYIYLHMTVANSLQIVRSKSIVSYFTSPPIAAYCFQVVVLWLTACRSTWICLMMLLKQAELVCTDGATSAAPVCGELSIYVILLVRPWLTLSWLPSHVWFLMYLYGRVKGLYRWGNASSASVWWFIYNIVNSIEQYCCS